MKTRFDRELVRVGTEGWAAYVLDDEPYGADEADPPMRFSGFFLDRDEADNYMDVGDEWNLYPARVTQAGIVVDFRAKDHASMGEGKKTVAEV